MKGMKNLKGGPICASKAEIGLGLLHGPRVLHGEEELRFGNGSDDDSQPENQLVWTIVCRLASRASAISSHRLASSASTMIRNIGCVPDGRRTMRPNVPRVSLAC